MAFGDSWLISVMMRFTSNGARVMNELGTVAGNTEKKVDRVTLAMTRLRDAVTGVSGGLALAGAAFEIYGIAQAAKFQLAMTNVFNATGARGAQRSQLTAMAMHLSSITAQDATTIAAELATSASSGLNDPARLMAAFPQIARAADVMMLSPKNINPVQASMQMAQLSHLFGAYSGASLHEMIDRSTRLMFTQPETLNAAITQGKQFIGIALRAGVSMKDMFTLLNTMGQTGYMRARGGTGVAAFIQYMEGAESLTSHMSKYRRAAMIDLGMFDRSGRNRFLDSQGNFQIMSAITYLAQKGKEMTAQHDQSRFVSDLINAFERQGGKFIATVTLPAIMAQMQRNQVATDRIAPPGQAVETLWANYTNTTAFQARLAWTNLKNVLIDMFLPVLPTVTSGLKGVATQLGHIGDFFLAHPDVAKGTVGGITLMTGLLAARFAGGMLYKGLDIMGGFAGLKGAEGASLGLGQKVFLLFDNIFTAGFASRLVPVFGRLFGFIFRAIPFVGERAIPIVGWILAIITAARLLQDNIGKLPNLIVAIENWWNASKFKIGYTIGYAFGSLTNMLVTAIQAMGSAIGATAQLYLSHPWMFVTGDAGAGAAAWQLAWQKAMGNRNTVGGPGFLTGLQMGAGVGSHGGVYDPRLGSVTIVIQDKTSSGIRSQVMSRGQIFTTPHAAGGLNLTSPSLGLHP